jgi:hypothetical protein
MAAVTAERIVEALKRSYVLTPKPPQPLARADHLPKLGGDR